MDSVGLTTSVTVTSGRASMGARKKPMMLLRAIHCALVLAYGLASSNRRGELQANFQKREKKKSNMVELYSSGLTPTLKLPAEKEKTEQWEKD